MVPVDGVTLSQAALAEALKGNPGTADESATTCAGGALPPAAAEKVSFPTAV